jgi:bifunctional DNA-binding transcriptional regulator/antitoxin component of YhaV-PrlF toxin-antitoxin module
LIVALLDSEIARCKYELGYNLLTIAAEPYIGVARVFELVIQPNMLAGAITTSSTVVTAVAAGALASPVTLTLASVTGFSPGDRVIVDVDDRQEAATVQSVSGSTITLLLSKAHSGTYTLTVERGESIVREILQRLRAIADKLGTAAIQQAGIAKVDEIEFFKGMQGVRYELQRLQTFWRNELSSALGVQNLRGASSGSAIAVY